MGQWVNLHIIAAAAVLVLAVALDTHATHQDIDIRDGGSLWNIEPNGLHDAVFEVRYQTPNGVNHFADVLLQGVCWHANDGNYAGNADPTDASRGYTHCDASKDLARLNASQGGGYPIGFDPGDPVEISPVAFRPAADRYWDNFFGTNSPHTTMGKILDPGNPNGRASTMFLNDHGFTNWRIRVGAAVNLTAAVTDPTAEGQYGAFDGFEEPLGDLVPIVTDHLSGIVRLRDDDYHSIGDHQDPNSVLIGSVFFDSEECPEPLFPNDCDVDHSQFVRAGALGACEVPDDQYRIDEKWQTGPLYEDVPLAFGGLSGAWYHLGPSH